MYGIKNWQKWIRCEKVTAPWNKGVIFTEQFSIKQLVGYFRSPQKKSLNITLLPLELQYDL
jgi:hypothetical protein